MSPNARLSLSFWCLSLSQMSVAASSEYLLASWYCSGPDLTMTNQKSLDFLPVKACIDTSLSKLLSCTPSSMWGTLTDVP